MAKCKYKEGCGYEFCLDDCCPEFEAAVETNADHIRSMTDKELARFVATKIVNIENHKMVEQGYTPTATQLVESAETMYGLLIRWLQQPAEEDTP